MNDPNLLYIQKRDRLYSRPCVCGIVINGLCFGYTSYLCESVSPNESFRENILKRIPHLVTHG